MDAPKPHPPAKAMMPKPQPSEKKPYIRRDHLTQRPFVDNAELLKLQEQMNKATRRIQRGEK